MNLRTTSILDEMKQKLGLSGLDHHFEKYSFIKNI